jgi:hypothetical protein
LPFLGAVLAREFEDRERAPSGCLAPDFRLVGADSSLNFSLKFCLSNLLFANLVDRIWDDASASGAG